MTAPARKVSYKTFVVERQISATRDQVWHTLIDLVDAGLIADAACGVEHVLSFEPPWRRVARLDIAPLRLVEHTVALRDDGDECLLVWAYIAEPTDGDTPADALDAALARLQHALTTWADAVSG